MTLSTRIFLSGILFGFLETWYFGWNSLPQSPAEVVCDGITVLITVLGIVVASTEGKKGDE